MTGSDERTDRRRGVPDVDRTDGATDDADPTPDDGTGATDPSQPETNPYYDVHDDEDDTTT